MMESAGSNSSRAPSPFRLSSLLEASPASTSASAALFAPYTSTRPVSTTTLAAASHPSSAHRHGARGPPPPRRTAGRSADLLRVTAIYGGVSSLLRRPYPQRPGDPARPDGD